MSIPTPHTDVDLHHRDQAGINGRSISASSGSNLFDYPWDTIRWPVRADTTASWRLMERVGMRRELYTVRESLHRSGGWLDGMGYAVLAEEWSAEATPG